MTPEEKAEELVLKYLRIDNNTKEWFNLRIAKQCALVAVNEVLTYFISDSEMEYWQEVKQEIEKL